MFCERCGIQLPDTAEFCTNCDIGIARAERETTTERIPDTEIQLRVQPSFKFGYMVVPSVIAFEIYILIFCFLIGMGGVEFVGVEFGVRFGVGIFLVTTLIMVIIIGINAIINKKQYDCYYYDFYKTKVIYKDTFLKLSEKEIKYKNIREVTMKQTVTQRYFNIGNIILYTNTEMGFGGISIMNVENVQDVYRNIKSIIDV